MMTAKRQLCAFTALVLTAADAPAPLPPSSLILVWAPWCAPCRTEIAQFDNLSKAVRPYRAIVLATENDPDAQAMLASIPADRVRFTDEGLWSFFRRTGTKGPVALPLSLVTDERGRICATIRGGATISAIESAKQTCATARQAAPRLHPG